MQKGALTTRMALPRPRLNLRRASIRTRRTTSGETKAPITGL
jgi:hypothetical protein